MALTSCSPPPSNKFVSYGYRKKDMFEYFKFENVIYFTLLGIGLLFLFLVDWRLVVATFFITWAYNYRIHIQTPEYLAKGLLNYALKRSKETNETK